MVGFWDVFNIFILVEALWVILPAYAANGLAPLAKYIGQTPIDGKRKFRGKRILGDGKTWQGLILGTVIGAVIGTVHMLAFPYLPWGISEIPLYIITMSPIVGAFLGFGAMIGDIVASFFKRQCGMKRGALAPILDQDDFVVGAFVFVSLINLVKWEWLVVALVFTPVFHYVASWIGFKLGIKQTPW